jgi:hypothetical protein
MIRVSLLAADTEKLLSAFHRLIYVIPKGAQRVHPSHNETIVPLLLTTFAASWGADLLCNPQTTNYHFPIGALMILSNSALRKCVF